MTNSSRTDRSDKPTTETNLAPKFDTAKLEQAVLSALESDGKIVVLTGAGISAESGIPTFRGADGYWTIGSKNYQSQEINTYVMLQRAPEEVWKWSLYMRGICQAAQPNAGHAAIARLEQCLGDRFTLITQNIDGLHLRAGNSLNRTLEVHGNGNYMRCTKGCSMAVYPIPAEMSAKQRGEDLSIAEKQMLTCPRCGAKTRPHILMWDEFYNEHFYREDSALEASREAALLIVVGTSGVANIPNRLMAEALSHGSTIFYINLDKTHFAEIALSSHLGMFFPIPSTQVLPAIADLVENWI